MDGYMGAVKKYFTKLYIKYNASLSTAGMSLTGARQASGTNRDTFWSQASCLLVMKVRNINHMYFDFHNFLEKRSSV